MSAPDSTWLCQLRDGLEPHGFLLRGGFHSEPGDGAPPGSGTVYLIGNAGSDMWAAFSRDGGPGNSTLDDWTTARLGPLAKKTGAAVYYYFEGPPYWPFIRWAQRAQGLQSSPLGMLLDPEYGLWHAYRAVFAFAERLPLPARAEITDICRTCVDKPCLSSCPVNAFSVDGYDVPACAGHLRGDAGSDCMSHGCQARAACPVGPAHRYEPAHAAFHMCAFLNAR